MKKNKKTADKKAYHREYMKKWRKKEKNKEKHRTWAREYYRQRKDDEDFMRVCRETHKKWAKANPEKIKEYAKKQYEKQKKRILGGCG